MSQLKNSGFTTPAERRLRERKRVNFLLDENGFSRRRGSEAPDLWSTTRRATRNGMERWEAFEVWQREAKKAQAKNVDGVCKLPRKLSLKAIFSK